MLQIPAPPSASGPYRPIRPPSPIRLLVMFVLVLLAIWYLANQS